MPAPLRTAVLLPPLLYRCRRCCTAAAAAVPLPPCRYGPISQRTYWRLLEARMKREAFDNGEQDGEDEGEE